MLVQVEPLLHSLLGLTICLYFVGPADALTCCNHDFEALVAAGGHTHGCHNDGITCNEFGCPEHRCLNHDIPETPPDPRRFPEDQCERTSAQTCSSANSLCRLLYYTSTVGNPNPQTGGLAGVETTAYILKECYDNSDRDLKPGCNLYHRQLYQTNNLRVTFQKECFCDKDYCNFNLTYACKNVKALTNTILTEPCLDPPDSGSGIVSAPSGSFLLAMWSFSFRF